MARAAVASSCYRQAEEWQVRAAQKGRRVVGGATDAGCKRQTQSSCFVNLFYLRSNERSRNQASEHISSFEYRKCVSQKTYLDSSQYPHPFLPVFFPKSTLRRLSHASSGTVPLLVTHIQDRPSTQRKPVPRYI